MEYLGARGTMIHGRNQRRISCVRLPFKGLFYQIQKRFFESACYIRNHRNVIFRQMLPIFLILTASRNPVWASNTL
jgi:hypothetical protein